MEFRYLNNLLILLHLSIIDCLLFMFDNKYYPYCIFELIDDSYKNILLCIFCIYALVIFQIYIQ
jgi:hypothetical protein